jgi:heme-degrading monooxygenase HmoA
MIREISANGSLKQSGYQGEHMDAMTRRELLQVSATTAAATAVTPLGATEDKVSGNLPFAVVFEVQTTAETHEMYLGTAQKLRPMLDTIPGFLSIERSSSLLQDHCLLSLSYWADEAALVQWRSTGEHHAAQQAGRDGIFADYRLRVGPVLFENRNLGDIPIEPASRYNRPPFHSKRYMPIARIDDILEPKPFEEWLKSLSVSNTIPELYGYRSLSNPGRYYVSVSSSDWGDAVRHSGQLLERWRGRKSASEPSFQIIEVERDYGMEVREQAPQFFRSPARSDSGRRS